MARIACRRVVPDGNLNRSGRRAAVGDRGDGIAEAARSPRTRFPRGFRVPRGPSSQVDIHERVTIKVNGVEWHPAHAGGCSVEIESAWEQARTAIAEAKTAGIPPESAPAKQPSRFEFTHEPEENPDRAWVLVDGTFDVTIIRTAEGIVIDVYPKDWIDPIDSLTVWDEEVAEASAEAETDDAGEA